MFRRRLILVGTLALAVAACRGSGGEPAASVTAPSTDVVMTSTTSTVPATAQLSSPTTRPQTVTTRPTVVPAVTTPTTVAPTTATPTTTTTKVAPSVTAPEPARPVAPPILVSGDDGLFMIHAGGDITRLLDGPVSYAVDDARGGLLYQVERGRDWEAFLHSPVPGRSTVVWWIPAGESKPRELLVPTPGAGHDLTLHDAFATASSFAVVYQRHEGTEPPFDGNMKDTLRIFDVATHTVTELFSVRGWEWNLNDVSGAAGLVVATEQQTGGAGCRVFDAAGGPVVGPGLPSVTDACFAETPCPTGCAFSGDGKHIVCTEWEASPSIFVNDLDSGAEIYRYQADRAWWPLDLDISGSLVLINRTGLFRLDERALPALIIDLAEPDPEPAELPVAGAARFATAPVETGGV